MKKKRRSLGVVLVLLIICITMAITMTMSLLYYRQTGSSLKANYREIVQENLQTRSGLFDDMMKEAYLLCINAAMDEQVRELIETDQEYQDLISVLQSYCEKDERIQSIYCYISEADILLKVSAESTQFSKTTAIERIWMDNVTEKSEMDPFSPVFNILTDYSIKKDLFTFTQSITNDDQVETGRLFVNIDERQVYFSCLRNVGSSVASISITQNDTVVSSSKLNLVGRKVQDTEDTINVSWDMDDTSYSILSISDSNVIDGQLISARNWITGITALLNLIICIPVILIVQYLLSPLRKLEEKMNIVREGNLTVRAEVERMDEIGSLAEHFNDMISQVENLIDELVTQKLLKKEAELEALSYQITPHFM